MAFDVDTEDLKAYSAQVGRAAEDAKLIREHTEKYGKGLQEPTEQGLILSALQLHDGAMTDGGKALSRVHTLLQGSSKELADSAAYYEDTDRSQAEALDRTYACTGRGPAVTSSGQTFSDVADVSTVLKAPAAPPEFSHGPFSEAVGTLGSWLSPSYWSLEAVKFVFQSEKDPLEEVLSWFTGDWASYAKCGEMWADSGSGLKCLVDNLTAGNAKLDQSWNGNAADAAFVYFDNLRKEIVALSESMTELQTYYKQVSLAAFEALGLIKGLLTGIADSLILIEIEIAAGTLLASTGVGAIVGYSLAALEVVKVIRMWGQITESYSAAEQSVKIAVAAAAALTGTFGIALENLPAPGSAYDHPAATV